MKKQIMFTLNGHPQGKERPVVYNRRAFTPVKTRQYETLVGYSARAALAAQSLQGPVTEPVRIYMVLSFKPPVKANKAQAAACLNQEYVPCCTPDCDNIAKAVLDGMNKVVYEDDRQVFELSVLKRYAQTEQVQVLVEWGMAQAV